MFVGRGMKNVLGAEMGEDLTHPIRIQNVGDERRNFVGMAEAYQLLLYLKQQNLAAFY
jgi:hypothetical protein